MPKVDKSLHEKLAEIIEWVPDGVYVVDGQGRTLLVNSAYEELSGTRREDLVGRHMSDLERGGYIDRSVSLLVLEHQRPMSIMQSLKNGKKVIVTANPVFEPAGQIQLIVTSVRDITYLNQVTEELERAKGLSQLHQHHYQFNLERDAAMIAVSEQMQQIVRQVRQIAPYPTSVLLSGPSGAGKEVIANLIHRCSNRNQKPFIKVNCAAIPDSLMESELFGYEAGAFTGARRDGKAGLFELAHEGTILLDEIGEMTAAVQAKLLRVLQDFQVFRVGGRTSRSVNVRVISATNQDLRALIKEGRFREDLYYRLQVVEVHIPPLQERPEDTKVLIQHYFESYCRAFRVKKHLRQDTIELLCGYHWPGNVRELKNLTENLIVSVPSLVIEPHHLPLHVQNAQATWENLGLKERMGNFERQVITEALQAYPSVRKAAEALGVDHSTLVKKLQRWRTAVVADPRQNPRQD